MILPLPFADPQKHAMKCYYSGMVGIREFAQWPTSIFGSHRGRTYAYWRML